MGLIGDLLHALTAFAVQVISTTGYLGVFLLMVAESMVLPVPSEAVMPFAGFLAKQGRFTVLGVLLASSLGSLVGSYLGYAMGRFGLLPLVERYGRYFLVHRHHVESAQHYFARRGVWAVLLCRFIPGVRHISSIPAGAARMPHLPFAAATLVGATVWNMFLFWIGYSYGAAAAEAVKPYLDVAGIAILLLLAGYILFEVRRARIAKGRAALAAPPAQAQPPGAPGAPPQENASGMTRR